MTTGENHEQKCALDLLMVNNDISQCSSDVRVKFGNISVQLLEKEHSVAHFTEDYIETLMFLDINAIKKFSVYLSI